MKVFLKKAGIPVSLLLIWCFPLLNVMAKSYYFVFLICYLAGILCFVFIKNKYLSLLAGLALSIPSVVYHSEYLFLIICPFFITYEYIQVFKERTDKAERASGDKFYAGANVSVFFGAAVLVYELITRDEGSSKSLRDVYYNSVAVAWAIFFVCVALAVICLRKKTPWKAISSKSGHSLSSLKELQFIHVSNVVCCIETFILFYFVDTHIVEDASRVFFFPWFMYLSLMLYYEDPIVSELIERAEGSIKKIAGKAV